MDKLQYDSFYKFLVSLGTILIATPIFCLYFVVNNQEHLLISKNEYETLTESSLYLLQEREKILGLVYKALPWILPILFGAGVFCLLYGGLKWKLIQKEIDEQTHLKTVEQRTNIENMSPSEVIVKALTDEVENEAQKNCEQNSSDESEPQVPPIYNQKFSIVKHIQIEEACCAYVANQLPSYFAIKPNIRIGNWEYDAIAISKKENTDLLYEFKYIKYKPSMSYLMHVMRNLEDSGINYQTISNRNFKCRLLFVIPDSQYEAIREYCLLKLGELKNIKTKMEFVKESALNIGDL